MRRPLVVRGRVDRRAGSEFSMGTDLDALRCGVSIFETAGSRMSSLGFDIMTF
jgi:hypothetical protein